MLRISLIILAFLTGSCYQTARVDPPGLGPTTSDCLEQCDTNREACVAFGLIRGENTDRCVEEWGYCTFNCNK